MIKLTISSYQKSIHIELVNQWDRRAVKKPKNFVALAAITKLCHTEGGMTYVLFVFGRMMVLKIPRTTHLQTTSRWQRGKRIFWNMAHVIKMENCTFEHLI